MELLKNIIILASTLAASVILGKMFLAENRKAIDAGSPWYTPYLSPPGLLIIAALSAPVIYWLLS